MTLWGLEEAFCVVKLYCQYTGNLCTNVVDLCPCIGNIFTNVILDLHPYIGQVNSELMFSCAVF